MNEDIRNHPHYKFMKQNAGRQLGDGHIKETNYQSASSQGEYPFEGNIIGQLTAEKEFSYMLGLDKGVAYFAETTQDISKEIENLQNPVTINRASLELVYRPTNNKRFVPMFQDATITDSEGKEIKINGLVGILLQDEEKLTPKRHAVMKATPRTRYQGVH